MTWFAVYRITDGQLVSIGTTVADPLPAGLASKSVGEAQPEGIWNNVTHTFDPAPVLKAVLTRRQFWQRFTSGEREQLQTILRAGTNVQKDKLNAFRDYIADEGGVDLNDAYIQTSVQLMETANVIGNGRAAVILA